MPTHALTDLVQRIIDRLELIGDGDAKWANTKQPTVQRLGDSVISGASPKPLIVVAATGGTVVPDSNTHVLRDDTIEIGVLCDQDGDPIDSALDRWLHDIHLAIAEDPTLGNSCAWFFPSADSREYHEQGGSLFVTATLQYAMDLADPSEVD